MVNGQGNGGKGNGLAGNCSGPKCVFDIGTETFREKRDQRSSW